VTAVSRHARPLFAAGAVGLSIVLGPARAAAEPSATEKATAEALFQQGTELMQERRFATACEKFEGSQQLDPALGTMLRLADCYDRIGRSASAWALFREAASIARTRNEPERERIAVERANDLDKRLSKIEIRVDRKNATAGLEIQLNGVNVPRATWDTPVPVDPGRQRVVASAPDKTSWSTTIDVPEGPGVRSIEVPALMAKPRVESTDTAQVAAARDSSSRGSTQRALGYVTGGLGVVGFAVGGFFSYQAYSKKQDSLAQCRVDDPNACTPQGKEIRDDAKGLANTATLAFIGGGALLAGGLVLVLSAPSSEPRAPTRELKASADLTRGGAGIRLEGTW
jgi:hypothetical protein